MNSISSTSRIAGLDGVRAIAVMAVIWHHTHDGFAWLPISKNGFLGVDLFFVLSGFLITHLLLQEKALTNNISLGNFYARRSLRIFPLYFALLAALASAFFVFAPENSPLRAAFFSELLYHATYTSNWIDSRTFLAITWSLSTEEQFYLLWPPVLALAGLRSTYLLGAALLASQAVNFGMLDPHLARAGVPYHSLAILQCTFTPILLGCLSAFALRTDNGTIGWIKDHSSVLMWISAMVAFATASWPGDMRGVPRLSFQLASATFLLSMYSQQQHPLTRVLELRPIVYIGTISYGLYLLHIIAIEVARPVVKPLSEGHGLPLFLLSAALSIVLAALSFRYFETPMLRLKSKFRGGGH
jgi:peptidoglycan/LPS O-acetylase OafA/YrhL